ncbi:MAG: SH3 domain-containing protein [Candidatus Omnitrophica bacterium]|nr:SH3 domain-containing protein [Candidatus Omnitrophota bacterium]
MKSLRICSFVFLIIGLAALGYADEHFPFQAQVSKESVNIRAGANTNFEKLDKLNRGAELIVLGKSFDWYKVQLPITAKAYIRADYLKINQNLVGELIGDKVNVRAAPNSESTSLGMIKKGTLLRLIAQINGWWQIEPPASAMGWVRQDFLSVKSSTVDSSIIRKSLHLEETNNKSLATIEIKGRLKQIVEPKADMRYELNVDGKIVYYVQSVPSLDRFKGATVLIKGFVKSDSSHPYNYPILRVISISLLL